VAVKEGCWSAPDGVGWGSYVAVGRGGGDRESGASCVGTEGGAGYRRGVAKLEIRAGCRRLVPALLINVAGGAPCRDSRTRLTFQRPLRLRRDVGGFESSPVVVRPDPRQAQGSGGRMTLAHLQAGRSGRGALSRFAMAHRRFDRVVAAGECEAAKISAGEDEVTLPWDLPSPSFTREVHIEG